MTDLLTEDTLSFIKHQRSLQYLTQTQWLFIDVLTASDGKSIKQPVSERLISHNESLVEVFNDAHAAVKGYEPFAKDHYVSLLTHFLENNGPVCPHCCPSNCRSIIGALFNGQFALMEKSEHEASISKLLQWNYTSHPQLKDILFVRTNRAACLSIRSLRELQWKSLNVTPALRCVHFSS